MHLSITVQKVYRVKPLCSDLSKHGGCVLSVGPKSFSFDIQCTCLFIYLAMQQVCEYTHSPPVVHSPHEAVYMKLAWPLLSFIFLSINFADIRI